MKSFKNNNNRNGNNSGNSRGNNNSEANNDRNISTTRADIREDMITLEEAKISSIRAASIDDEAETKSRKLPKKAQAITVGVVNHPVTQEALEIYFVIVINVAVIPDSSRL